MMMGNDWGWESWAAMSLMMVLFWAFLIGAVLLVMRSLNSPGSSRPPTVREFLDERFARGEIDEEEYRHRRAVLESKT